MKVKILETAEKELEKIANPLNKRFGKHIEKIALKETSRHLKHGLPYLIENVTKQARIVYYFEEEIIYVMHCFKNHKEYERWYKSFK
jgi:mRNA-degrading endonuclease RelE of RelBE toxin-antitoxin system